MSYNVDVWRRAAQIRYRKRLRGGKKGVLEGAFTGSPEIACESGVKIVGFVLTGDRSVSECSHLQANHGNVLLNLVLFIAAHVRYSASGTFHCPTDPCASQFLLRTLEL